MKVVGAVLEGPQFHPGRTGRNHLRVLAAAAGLPASRVDEMLRLVELNGAGEPAREGLLARHAPAAEPGGRAARRPARARARRAGQRARPPGHPLAARLPAGQASEGRTVLVSSHVLAEMAQTVDEVVVISRGKLVAQGSLDELTHGVEAPIWVRTPEPERLRAALAAREGRGRRARRGRRRLARRCAARRSRRWARPRPRTASPCSSSTGRVSRSSTCSWSSPRARRRAGDPADRRRAPQDPHHADVLGLTAGAVGPRVAHRRALAGARRQPGHRDGRARPALGGGLQRVAGAGARRRGRRRRVQARHDRVDAARDARSACAR